MLKEMGVSCSFLQLQDGTNNKDLSYNRMRILEHGSCRVLTFLSSGNWKALPFAENRSCAETGKEGADLRPGFQALFQGLFEHFV